MAKLITVYWRDIPAQVIGRQPRGNHRKELPARFAKAIDRAAMRAGRGSSDAYLADWRRESRMVDGDIEQMFAIVENQNEIPLNDLRNNRLQDRS